MDPTYNPADIEKSVQAHWDDNNAFESKEDLSREKYYCLSMLPYPSGELHMGHVRNYTLSDLISRYQHMKGKNVLHPMGWDAFGLPAENAAIKHELAPYTWTQKNIKKMKKQFQQLGYSFDWNREITTCEPSYYRWEQWLFLQLYKKGLAYKKNAIVNWDPVDCTVLANEQVVDGKGWRSGAPVERREISQWFFKITEYANELLDDIDKLDGWPDQVRQMQRNWIGRSEGVNIKFKIEKQKEHLSIFTTRPDTLMGVSYVGIAPTHPVAKALAEDNKAIATFIKQCQSVKVSEAEMATQEKKGIDTGLKAIHPITKKRVPIWIANFVLMEYGSGAVMAVPAHDQRDFEFATQYDLPKPQVIEPPKKIKWDFNEAAYTDTGTLINSGDFDGLKSKKAIAEITQALTDKKLGGKETHFRLRDWGISRQRYWGTPIPIIYCKHCGEVLVPDNDLPVELPTELIPDGHGSPLAKDTHFVKTQCPTCGKAAKRETDTMDTFVESSWYYARYCSFDQDSAMLDDRARYWTPVDQYIGGIEHAVMHLLYARFMHKVLRDQGLLNSDEPFTRLLTQGMVLKDGAKMSKSKGNTVSPQALIKKYGADTVRLFMMFAAPPDQSLEWSDSGVEGAFRYLNKLWNFCVQVKDDMLRFNQEDTSVMSAFEEPELQTAHQQLHQHLSQANNDMDRLQFNTVISACMKILNLLSKLNPSLQNKDLLIFEGLHILLRLLAPIAPHITHQLWIELGYGDNLLDASWPKVNAKALHTSQIEMMIQVNGKLRGKMLISSDMEQGAIEKIALAENNIQTHLADKSVKKVIIVPNKLINIVAG